MLRPSSIASSPDPNTSQESELRVRALRQTPSPARLVPGSETYAGSRLSRRPVLHPSNGGQSSDVYEPPNVFIVLVFPDSSEFRWVHERPRLGSGIRSSLGQSWRVDEVLQSGVNTYTVHCVEQRGSSIGVRDLAADLLERTRRAVSLEGRRRRRRYLP